MHCTARTIHVLAGLLIIPVASAWGQPTNLFWLGQEGQTSSDATDFLSWSPQQLPDANTRANLSGGGGFNKVLDLGANDVTWYQAFFNNNGPSTINGTGTINLAIPYDADGNGDPLSGVDQWAIFSAGGEAFGPLVGTPSVINPNVSTASYIESNGGHNLTFNGNVEALTVQAYAGTKIVFNGNVTLTAAEFPDTRFLTGNNTNPSITFNGNVALFPNDSFPSTGYGIRNQLTVNLGPNAALSSNISNDGWGLLNLYNGSTLRVFGDNRIGTATQIFARGANSILTNTLDLNGHSDHVSFMGTAADATLILDFGATLGANSLQWDSHEFTDGHYQIKNFSTTGDTLTLGDPGVGFWFETGDSVAEADRLSRITIDGVSYAPYDPLKTDPYWTVVDPTVSRDVAFFNYSSPSADFNSDSAVNGKDFLTWQRGFGLTGQSSNANGDADFSGTVNGADLTVWKGQYGAGAATVNVAGVPEPTALTLGCAAAFAALTLRRGSCS